MAILWINDERPNLSTYRPLCRTLQAHANPLDEAAIDKLEILLSIPLDYLALKVLELEHYSDLLTFLPWDNRCQVYVVMLTAVHFVWEGDHGCSSD